MYYYNDNPTNTITLGRWHTLIYDPIVIFYSFIHLSHLYNYDTKLKWNTTNLNLNFAYIQEIPNENKNNWLSTFIHLTKLDIIKRQARNPKNIWTKIYKLHWRTIQLLFKVDNLHWDYEYHPAQTAVERGSIPKISLRFSPTTTHRSILPAQNYLCDLPLDTLTCEYKQVTNVRRKYNHNLHKDKPLDIITQMG